MAIPSPDKEKIETGGEWETSEVRMEREDVKGKETKREVLSLTSLPHPFLSLNPLPSVAPTVHSGAARSFTSFIPSLLTSPFTLSSHFVRQVPQRQGMPVPGTEVRNEREREGWVNGRYLLGLSSMQSSLCPIIFIRLFLHSISRIFSVIHLSVTSGKWKGKRHSHSLATHRREKYSYRMPWQEVDEQVLEPAVGKGKIGKDMSEWNEGRDRYQIIRMEWESFPSLFSSFRVSHVLRH